MPLLGPPNIDKLKEKRDVDGLIKALRHKDATIRGDAAWALWNLVDMGWDRFAFPNNVKPWNLYGEAFTVRDIAPWALGELGDARAVGPLNAALKSMDVRASAEQALRRLDTPEVQQHLAELEAKERAWREQDEAARNAMPSSQQREEAVLRLETSEDEILKTIADSGPANIDRIIEALLDEITDTAGLAGFARGPLGSDAKDAARKAAGRYATDHRDSLKGDVDPRQFADKLVRPAVAAYLRVLKTSA